MQNKSDLLDTDLLSIRTTMQNPPGVCEAAPTARAVVICFASFIGSSSGLEFEHQREVSSVLLPFPLPASPSVHLAMYFPLVGSDVGLSCSAEMTR